MGLGGKGEIGMRYIIGIICIIISVVCDIILFVTNKDKSVKDKRYMVVLMICSAVAVLCMLDGIID